MLRSFRLSKFRRKSRGRHTVNAEEKAEEEISFHLAASLGEVEKVKNLLANGAKVNMVNEHGNTALHEAAWKGYSQTVEVLCKHGADVYIKNKSGFSALHLTCQNGHNQSCRVLLLAGCKPDIKNSYGDTPLHTAARYGHAGVARILISAHTHVNETNKTALKRRGSGKIPKMNKNCLSPYGCHMFPDASSFPSPKLDSLPTEPLMAGEQYYIDLAGNIKKGPTGFGHSYCCTPFFRHMEKALEREKSHIINQVNYAHKNLSTRIDSLEQRTQNYLDNLCQTVEDKITSERKECLRRYEKHSKCKTHDSRNRFSKALDLHSASHHNLGISMNPDTERSEKRCNITWNSPHQHHSYSEETLTKLNSNNDIPTAMRIVDSMVLAASEDNLLERIPNRREALNENVFYKPKYSQWSNLEFKNQPRCQSNINLCQWNHCNNKENLGTSLCDINNDIHSADALLCRDMVKPLLQDNHLKFSQIIINASQNKTYSELNKNSDRVKPTLPATCV